MAENKPTFDSLTGDAMLSIIADDWEKNHERYLQVYDAEFVKRILINTRTEMLKPSHNPYLIPDTLKRALKIADKVL